jgi:hypothetical protein
LAVLRSACEKVEVAASDFLGMVEELNVHVGIYAANG